MIDAFRSGPKRPRMLALAVLACALLLRLLVPAGWMPIRDARGLHLTLCTGTGPMTVPMASMPGMDMGAATKVGAAHHMPTDGQGVPEHPCAFSHLGLALAEPALTPLTPPFAPATAMLAGLAQRVAIGRGLAAPPPPQTGPPIA